MTTGAAATTTTGIATGMAGDRSYAWSDPLDLAALGAGRSGLDLLTDCVAGRVPAPPIMATLGFRLAAVEAGRAVFECVPQPWHFNPIGSVHGGLACTLADSAMGCAVHTRLPAGIGYTSLDVNIRFTRPLPVGGLVTAVGEVLTLGRRVATAQAELRDADDRLLAHATTSCLLFPVAG